MPCGNVGLLLVHHTPSELEFMNKGYGEIRYNLMYNDFVLVGPINDIKICNFLRKNMSNFCLHRDVRHISGYVIHYVINKLIDILNQKTKIKFRHLEISDITNIFTNNILESGSKDNLRYEITNLNKKRGLFS